MDFSGETLGNLDTCHPDEGQILTTTDAASSFVGVCGREVEEAKILVL